MRKRQLSGSEQDQLQRIRKENQKLKSQIDRLRKQLSRIDVDRFQGLKDVIDAQDREEQEQVALENNTKHWECFHCPGPVKGILRLVVIERRAGAIYNRVCGDCGHKTKFQKYTNKVK